MASFKYMIAMDLELTCGQNSEKEIIEFPASLFDISTGKILEEFHTFVKPKTPKLTEFCKSLTGISNADIATGVPLKQALADFDAWLKKFINYYGLVLAQKPYSKGNCTFVTWTDNDLGDYIPNDCKQKNIPKPDYFNGRINAQAIFMKRYPESKKTLKDAMERLGLKFEGREHSGRDDTRNLCALVTKMVGIGMEFSYESLV